MFTGIVETIGEVVARQEIEGNIEFQIRSEITSELHINQSVSHNGVCLTVTGLVDDTYKVTVISETISKSSLGKLKPGDSVNLERSMPSNGRFDGHMVLGHVDQTGICKSILEDNGSHIFTFSYDEKSGNITVEKGSICINGVSLTVVNSLKSEFSVAVIPYTFSHTNFQCLKKDDSVNLEFDILGKYIRRILDKY